MDNSFVNPSEIGPYNAYLCVDMDTVTDNYRLVQKYIGENVGIIPVIKGNCYGYGLVPMAKLFTQHCGAGLIANGAVWEAVQLREAGITADILILGGVPRHLIGCAAKYGLTLPLFDAETAEILASCAQAAGKTVDVHLKIETGMNRLGVKPGADLAALLDRIAELPQIRVRGMYTHFATSTADYDEPFAIEQHDRFLLAIDQVREAGIEPEYIHCCNSAAIAWFTDAYHTHVRSCSSVLGHAAMEDGREPIGLTEPVSLRTFVTSVHDVLPGESVGYSRAWVAEKPTKLATLSIGFADGIYPPWARLHGPVLIGGRRARFLGICMDQSFVDVTGIPCEVGWQATLFGRDGDEHISVRDIEVHTGYTFEFLLGTLGPRIARIYRGNNS